MTSHHPPHKKPKSKHDRRTEVAGIVAALVFGGLVASGVVAWQMSSDALRRGDIRDQAVVESTRPSDAAYGHFRLKDVEGHDVSDADLRGHISMIYLGYTYCPDQCPTALSTMGRALDALGEDAKKILPIFIDIDPARDTPAKLKEYVLTFHETIRALTGTEAEIAAVAKAFRYYYEKIPAEPGEDPNTYEFDHSAQIYLHLPDGRRAAALPDDLSPQALTTALRAVLDGQPVPPVVVNGDEADVDVHGDHAQGQGDQPVVKTH